MYLFDEFDAPSEAIAANDVGEARILNSFLCLEKASTGVTGARCDKPPYDLDKVPSLRHGSRQRALPDECQAAAVDEAGHALELLPPDQHAKLEAGLSHAELVKAAETLGAYFS